MTLYFGENLKKLRKEKELTQESLADFLGVTFQAVSKWERGETYPDITMLPAIASFFNITIDDLLGIDKVKKEEMIDEYLKQYDDMKLKDVTLTYNIFKTAVKEFPGDFRILIRYMELLYEVKGFMQGEYKDISKEIASIYEKIQNHCTDDNIRIRSKVIMISHLLTLYHCVPNEDGKYRIYKEYLKNKGVSDERFKRVSELTRILMTQYASQFVGDEYEPAKINMITTAAYFYNIGYMTIPDRCIDFPKKNESDYRMYQKHTIAGGKLIRTNIASSCNYFISVCTDICMYHHERADGTTEILGLTDEQKAKLALNIIRSPYKAEEGSGNSMSNFYQKYVQKFQP